VDNWICGAKKWNNLLKASRFRAWIIRRHPLDPATGAVEPSRIPQGESAYLPERSRILNFGLMLNGGAHWQGWLGFWPPSA
jgi:hypothetical protein